MLSFSRCALTALASSALEIARTAATSSRPKRPRQDDWIMVAALNCIIATLSMAAASSTILSLAAWSSMNNGRASGLATPWPPHSPPPPTPRSLRASSERPSRACGSSGTTGLAASAPSLPAAPPPSPATSSTQQTAGGSSGDSARGAPDHVPAPTPATARASTPSHAPARDASGAAALSTYCSVLSPALHAWHGPWRLLARPLVLLLRTLPAAATHERAPTEPPSPPSHATARAASGAAALSPCCPVLSPLPPPPRLPACRDFGPTSLVFWLEGSPQHVCAAPGHAAVHIYAVLSNLERLL
eukprot:scaffold94063_cov60-Phaeocystis_antarctica.AAC.3